MKDKYKIVKLLGEGAFGKAYLAKSDNEEKQYVIKQVIMEGMEDIEKRETFDEAVVLKKLDHPNIIKFKEVFRQKKPKDALNIVTEYADGGDLGQKIEQQKKKPFPESQILDYITQICLALQHIHKKKIIHRDLKSNNVFLMKSGIVKVGDFGISKIVKTTQEKARTTVGTPYYLAPEIINTQPYDSKVDIWALGVLLYELMTFKMPFVAQSSPLLNIKMNRDNYAPPPDIYSNEIKDLLKRCLTVEPEKRPNIDEILNMPLIKDRINQFEKEVYYDQDLSNIMSNKYKDKKKEEDAKELDEQEQVKEIKKNTTPKEDTPVKINNEEKKKTSDKNKNKIGMFKNTEKRFCMGLMFKKSISKKKSSPALNNNINKKSINKTKMNKKKNY